MNALIESAVVRGYEIDGVTVASVKLSGNYHGIAFQHESSESEEPIRGVICSGKLTRAERRRIVKASLLAFKYDALQEIESDRIEMKGAKVRAFIFRLKTNKTEAK